MYSYEIDKKLIPILRKIAKKNKALYDAIQKQIIKIAKNPILGRPLRYDLKCTRRVHIGPFVLIYEVREKEHKVIFLKFAHHDEAYE